MSKLIILATPIGNLKDASPNLLEQLGTLKYLFCEDTRMTSKLLNLLSLNHQCQLISYHKFNEKEKLDEALELLKLHPCGLISDAGYPCISDPGYLLVKACHTHQIPVEVIDGPSAVNHAIVQSGFSSHGYMFIGFLPKNYKESKLLLNRCLSCQLPIVFFEAVHRINDTIKFLQTDYGDHEIYIGRELSKKFETYYVGLARNVPPMTLKGEFSLVLNCLTTDDIQITPEQATIDQDLQLLLAANIKLKNACKYLASKYQLKANDLYNVACKKLK